MSERTRVIGISALSVKELYRHEYKGKGLNGSRFWVPYVSAFQSYFLAYRYH